MRVNIYTQELTSEVQLITAGDYSAVRLILHSSDRLHCPPRSDDRSAVTFWIPDSPKRREAIAQAFERMAAMFRSAPPVRSTGAEAP